ncbi:hypothetical protein [Planktothrix prolifica]|uniref:hypothetical protein n=1 Tax=Planktothrix prolifica TaxID=54307 RepID=UPI00047E98C1|nr:hypothetical protein [Planktothrix prolifica]
MSNLREYLDKNPQQAKRLLGMEYEQLIELIQAAELLEQEKRQEQGLLYHNQNPELRSQTNLV